MGNRIAARRRAAMREVIARAISEMPEPVAHVLAHTRGEIVDMDPRDALNDAALLMAAGEFVTDDIIREHFSAWLTARGEHIPPDEIPRRVARAGLGLAWLSITAVL